MVAVLVDDGRGDARSVEVESAPIRTPESVCVVAIPDEVVVQPSRRSECVAPERCERIRRTIAVRQGDVPAAGEG